MRVLALTPLFALSVLGTCNRTPQPSLTVEEYCEPATSFLAGKLGMPVAVDPDTIQDWRTGQTVMGCRVYAAATTSVDISVAASSFYEQIMSAGWSRTPNPSDMPNEAAIRLRMEDVDCLYHVYRPPLLRTPSEIEVTTSILVLPGEGRFNILAQCMPAMEAAPA